jgi:HSP20 family protein
MRIMRINNNKRSLANPTYSPLRSMLDELLSMQSWFDDVFNRSMPSLNYNMAMADVWEEDGDYYIKMALPGVDKDHVDVQVESNVVRIKGGKKEEEKSEEGKQYYLNRLESYFEQTFTLPGDIDVEKIEAKMKNGVLELKLPKVAQNKPKQITIKSE